LKENKSFAILVLAYGQDQNGEINAETRDRCLAAIDGYRRLRNEGQACFFIISNTSSKMVRGREVVMGKKMAEFIYQQGVDETLIIYTPDEGIRGGENTGGEIDSCLEWFAASNLSPEGRLGFATTWYHVPRVRYLFFMRGLWPTVVCSAKDHFDWVGDVLVEFGPPVGRYGKFWKNLMMPYYSVRQRIF